MVNDNRIAVVLFNLGGPDSPAAVEPFLLNLFNDPAIIGLPSLLRRFVARMIVRKRGPTAREIYARIGGASPLLPNTETQARSLTQQLQDSGNFRVFVCMRYWHPMAESVAAEVAAYRPDQVILLPLYPQYSSTTTASSFGAWRKAASATGLTALTKLICCYPTAPGFIAAAAALVESGIDQAKTKLNRQPRVLFSAHGLPRKVVARGDPYPQQVESSARAIAERLGLQAKDWVVCYQSRVGPLEWIRPYTDDEIRRAGADGVPVVLFPIAFVSEHSETLVELDMEYRHLAEQAGVPLYLRVPTVGTSPEFIAALAGLVQAGARSPRAVQSQDGSRLCAAGDRCCLNPAA